MQHIEGVAVEESWPSLSAPEKLAIAEQLNSSMIKCGPVRECLRISRPYIAFSDQECGNTLSRHTIHKSTFFLAVATQDVRTPVSE